MGKRFHMTLVNKDKALEKARKYCAYQERCHSETRSKLYEMGLWKKDVEEILSLLITEGYLNEERFARTFAGGKFRIKKWGRRKILSELKRRNISEYCMKQAMNEINEEDYKTTLRKILTTKLSQIKNLKTEIRNYKAVQYAISRGYESELAWRMIKS